MAVGIDYKIHQQYHDKWAGLVGGNWGITRRWSVAAEYHGFTGSRDGFIASVGYSY